MRNKLPDSLAALEQYNKRFLIFRVTPRLTTETVNGLGKIIEPADEANWLTVNSAIAASELMGLNCCVGFVLYGSGLFMFEVPSCDGGAELFEKLRKILVLLRDAAQWRINKGCGIRVMGRYQGNYLHSATDKKLEAKLYTTGVVPLPLGLVYAGDVSADCTAAFVNLVAENFTSNKPAPPDVDRIA